MAVDKIDELDLSIDENRLPEEWKRQAQMMLTYGIKAADAQQEEDEARSDLTVIDAKLDAEIRNAAAEAGVKVTEASIMSSITVNPKHIKAVERLNEAHYNARVMRAAVDAIGHRKSALQGMTDLFMRQWYADPKNDEQPADLREAAGTPTKAIKGRRVRRPGQDED